MVFAGDISLRNTITAGVLALITSVLGLSPLASPATAAGEDTRLTVRLEVLNQPAWGDELDLHGRFVAGYVGTHGLAHALPAVLEAAERLRDRQDIAFFFAGSGAERAKVERIVAERDLHNVRLVPRQPKERMPALWSLCDLAIVPLRDTPLFASVIPSKIFESMGMGVPILISLPEGEATRLVRDCGAGICIAPESPAAMADAIAALADDRIRHQALCSAACRAAPLYSRRAQAAKMVQVLESVVAVRRGRSPEMVAALNAFQPEALTAYMSYTEERRARADADLTQHADVAGLCEHRTWCCGHEQCSTEVYRQ